MKRYLIFACDPHSDQSGGWYDFMKDYDNIGEAKDQADLLQKHYPYESVHVTDTLIKEIVYTA